MLLGWVRRDIAKVALLAHTGVGEREVTYFSR